MLFVLFGERRSKLDVTCLVLGGEGARVDDVTVEEQCGFDYDLIVSLRDGLALLVSEVPSEGLRTSSLWCGSCDGIQLLVSLLVGLYGLHPCRHTGRTHNVATFRLLATTGAAFCSVRGNEECFHYVTLLVLNPDGVLVGTGASLTLIVERYFEGLSL